MILVLLDNISPNYSQWKVLFLNTLSTYELIDHVLVDPLPTDVADPHWRHMDCTVRSWLYGTVAPDLIEIATTPEPMICSLWLGIEDQFIRNHETRAMILIGEFCTFVQGDLSISEYCHCLKGMANALGDLGEVVLDRTLVLTILRGPNGRFSHMAAFLKRQRPFSTFAVVCNDLQLEEIELASKPRSSSTALVASMVVGRVPPATSSAPLSVRAPTPSNPLAKKNNYRKNNLKKGSSNQQQGFFATPTAVNPWLRSLQLYDTTRPDESGLLGPRPSMPPQRSPQALLAQ
jgi:hypothetical protein